jgi:simple sugar transport system permease protein/ribose transport system permease protein
MQYQLMGVLRKRTEVGAAVVTILLLIGFSATTGGVWLSGAIMREVLRVTSILAIMAFGEALVITTGEIDISVGSIFGIVGLTYLGLAPHFGVPPAILIGLALAVSIGAVNGFIVAYFRLPSLIVTLGSLFVFRGLAFAISKESLSFAATEAMRADAVFQLFGNGDIFGYNNALVWAIAALLLVQYVLFFTPIGNRLLALGGNAESAHSRGVHVLYTKWGVFIACGFFAGLAGILQASNLGYADGGFGRQRELQTIAAAVLGGCALAGGRSSIIGTFLGAFILSGIESYLVIKSIQPQWYILLLGLIVVLVSLADRALTHWVTRLSKR